VRRVFEQGAYTDRAFRAEAERAELSGRDRAFAMRIAYGVVQRRATLDHVLGSLADRQVAGLDAPVLAALRLGAYQLLFMDGVADHAAVTESVDLAREAGSRGHGLVNAVLRRTAREGRALIDALGESTPQAAALRHSHPAWVAEMWWAQLGPDDALALMRASNEPAESAARVNTLLATAEDARAELAREQVGVAQPDQLVPEALVLEQPYDLHGSTLFERGAIMPQSRGSMLVARALDPQPGERVLDLCAAPGAKTTHVAALMANDGEVVAVEHDARRARDLERNAARLGVANVGVVVGDAAEPAFGTDYPPCSDLGTLQSRPDARWRKTPDQIAELAQLQRRILDAGAGAVRPGGRLVYSTCTIRPRENEDQVKDFLERHSNFEACDLSERFEPLAAHDRRFVQTLPHRERTDGFFIAAFERHG
jgi:16S rRNA (cytosine967-C5)-methyltransferase